MELVRRAPRSSPLCVCMCCRSYCVLSLGTNRGAARSFQFSAHRCPCESLKTYKGELYGEVKSGDTHPAPLHARSEVCKLRAVRESAQYLQELITQLTAVLKHKAVVPILHQLVKALEANRTHLRNNSFKEFNTENMAKCALTGSPQPNMSTTFIGKSRPEEDVCKQTPKSLLPSSSG